MLVVKLQPSSKKTIWHGFPRKILNQVHVDYIRTDRFKTVHRLFHLSTQAVVCPYEAIAISLTRKKLPSGSKSMPGSFRHKDASGSNKVKTQCHQTADKFGYCNSCPKLPVRGGIIYQLFKITSQGNLRSVRRRLRGTWSCL